MTEVWKDIGNLSGWKSHFQNILPTLHKSLSFFYIWNVRNPLSFKYLFILYVKPVFDFSIFWSYENGIHRNIVILQSIFFIQYVFGECAYILLHTYIHAFENCLNALWFHYIYSLYIAIQEQVFHHCQKKPMQTKRFFYSYNLNICASDMLYIIHAVQATSSFTLLCCGLINLWSFFERRMNAHWVQINRPDTTPLMLSFMFIK